MADFTFDYPNSVLSKKLDKMGTKLGAVVLMYAATKAQKIEAQMKSNRPWTDRTNMAKATLRAFVSQPSEDKVRVTLAYGVSYGIWLELANAGKYAIIKPTIIEEAPTFVSDLDDIFSRLELVVS